MLTLSFSDLPVPKRKRNNKILKRYRRAFITCETCGWQRKADILKPGVRDQGLINPWWSMSMLRSADKHRCPPNRECMKRTVREVGRVLGIGNKPMFWDVKIDLIGEREGLEKLWPGCTVYWDNNSRLSGWRNFYIRLKVLGQYPHRDSLDDEVKLVAFKTNDDGQLELVQSSNAVIKNAYVGAPVRAEYAVRGEMGHWVVIR